MFHKIKRGWVKKLELHYFIDHITLKDKSNTYWYLDSGCSKHMIGNCSLFKTFEEYNEDIITSYEGKRI